MPVEQKLLQRGETTYWLDAPHDLHSQWGQDGHAAWELVLMGRNNQGQDRLFFEPDKRRVWQGPVSELRSATGGYRPSTVSPSGDTRADDSVEGFAQIVAAIIAAEPDQRVAVEKITPHLARLLQRDDLLDARYRVVSPEGRTSYRYYRSPDGTLTIGGPVFAPGRPTVVHNHNTWGVIGIYTGNQRTTRYVRTDDGSRPGRAELIQTAEETLGPGVIYALLPPDDIHRVEAIDGPSLSIHVLGVDLTKQHRQFFDVEAQTYRDVLGEGVMS